MSFAELLTQYGINYLLGFLMTILLTVLSFALAFVIGILITVLRVSPVKPLKRFAEFYVQVFRNIPGAALLILFVYAFPYLNVVLSYFACVLMATSLIPSAFMSENLISGINTIDKGQVEAARSLGMTFSQIVWKIIIPQSLRSTILQMTNLLVATMLTTALASQVPMDVNELTGLVAHINSYSLGGIKAFVISAVLYVILSVLIGYAGNRLDKKMRIKK